ncbi:hypothetical protein PROFUN_03599 [Planoprotostelium fungivorum]|uniref:Putative gamma-glutamylcyclotransferase n=1 Tax=Planoprotostelium fungivorum TaxID=1890364 RepID=A0A2P6MSL5_9EUKA|nr:hypothetical protein PROFUN_03599 [Planoprotostelium fungivorum]
MSHRIFVYGSLMCKPVLQALLGRVPDMKPAMLQNYHRYSIRGFTYPAAFALNGGSIQMHPEIMKGDQYKAVDVHVNAVTEGPNGIAELQDASVYVFQDSLFELLYGEWDFELFEKERLKDFMDRLITCPPSSVGRAPGFYEKMSPGGRGFEPPGGRLFCQNLLVISHLADGHFESWPRGYCVSVARPETQSLNKRKFVLRDWFRIIIGRDSSAAQWDAVDLPKEKTPLNASSGSNGYLSSSSSSNGSRKGGKADFDWDSFWQSEDQKMSRQPH